MIYSDLEVIDGDTIKVLLWPSKLAETIRIYGLDCDEMDTKRGKEQRDIAIYYLGSFFAKPYIFFSVGITRGNKWRYRKRDAYGRLLARVYVWDKWRYRDYSEMMIKNGNVKKGSKWNE